MKIFPNEEGIFFDDLIDINSEKVIIKIRIRHQAHLDFTASEQSRHMINKSPVQCRNFKSISKSAVQIFNDPMQGASKWLTEK